MKTKPKVQRPKIPKPNQWPIPLHKFYSLVVRGRDEGNSKVRLLRFLPEYLLRTSIELSGKSTKEAGEKAKSLISYWKSSGIEEVTWDWLTDPYLDWWNTIGVPEGKSRGGIAAAKKRAIDAQKAAKKAVEKAAKKNSLC